MITAPLAIFCYNRPWHLEQTVESLKRNPGAEELDVLFFSDAAKTQEHAPAVAEVRRYLKTVEGFRSVQIIESDKNKGLSKSIIEGVSQILAKHDSVIVLEDDMQCSPFFLGYMQSALDQYKNVEEVISIHAYSYPIQDLPTSFFLKGADCWGWATWRRGWEIFNADGNVLLEQIKAKGLNKRFDFENSYPYTRMLERQVKGENHSWAVRWYASALLADKLTLYPGKSLIRNLGNDASGTHSEKTDLFDPYLANQMPVFPNEVKESAAAYKAFAKFFKQTRRTAILRKLGLGRFF
ncbi:MAG: glycosyltransferase [Bacteroidetes bacterium]|nr:MAG: glycosyltransferase [Bacteroidota bacterium]